MEKKQRVPRGEKYWCIGQWGDIITYTEENYPIDDWLFQYGNYFATEESAEQMAHKLRAVLAGADVIEMPSEEEIEDAMKTSVTESILCVAPYETFTPKATDLLECAWIKGAEWLKSKIVK